MVAATTVLCDGLAFGMLLFTITVGLSVTMGTLKFTNLAHGAFAMGGAYLAVLLVSTWKLPFALAVPCVFVALFGIGLASENLVFRHFYRRSPLEQVLLTIGIVFMAVAAARFFFGPLSASLPLPSFLVGSFQLLGVKVPIYRLFLSGFGASTALLLWLCIERTLVGAKLRAAVENQSMAAAVGINVPVLLGVVFAVGTGLAGVGGALSVELLGLTPTYALDYLSLVLIIVIVGGLGSIKGAFYASLIIGSLDNAGKYLLPEAGGFLIYLVAFVLLLWRPGGLFGDG